MFKAIVVAMNNIISNISQFNPIFLTCVSTLFGCQVDDDQTDVNVFFCVPERALFRKDIARSDTAPLFVFIISVATDRHLGRTHIFHIQHFRYILFFWSKPSNRIVLCVYINYTTRRACTPSRAERTSSTSTYSQCVGRARECEFLTGCDDATEVAPSIQHSKRRQSLCALFYCVYLSWRGWCSMNSIQPSKTGTSILFWLWPGYIEQGFAALYTVCDMGSVDSAASAQSKSKMKCVCSPPLYILKAR